MSSMFTISAGTTNYTLYFDNENNCAQERQQSVYMSTLWHHICCEKGSNRTGSGCNDKKVQHNESWHLVLRRPTVFFLFKFLFLRLFGINQASRDNFTFWKEISKSSYHLMHAFILQTKNCFKELQSISLGIYCMSWKPLDTVCRNHNKQKIT